MRVRKLHRKIARWGAVCLLFFGLAGPGPSAMAFVYETDYEFVATGDFDGDGRLDLAVADKASGRYRIAYQLGAGEWTWASVRSSGILKNLTGFAVGPLLESDRDALAFTEPNANQINLVEAADPKAASEPLPYFPATVGPNALVAIDIGGDGNTELHDLCVGTVYNDPEPNRLDLLRNDGSAAEPIDDYELSGKLNRANALRLKVGGPALLSALIQGEEEETFRASDLQTGKPVEVLRIDGLPVGSDYVAGFFGGRELATVVLYQFGKKDLTAYGVRESAPGQFAFEPPRSFTLDNSVLSVFVVGDAPNARLLVLGGDGEMAVLLDFDGLTAPKPLQTMEAPRYELFSGVGNFGKDILILTRRQTEGASSKYQRYGLSGTTYLAAGAVEDLTTLDETVGPIHKMILANLEATQESQMKPYTNTIPGTKIKYVMLPVPSGEFVMGTPEAEEGRGADEGPQHRVRVGAFWMGKFEVTWDEYELFMYPDEERKFREDIPTDPEIDKISDAVARPSRPYTDMTFSMGRYGYPAISMTQHGANKYCQWLSAKTGHFYRLPTEAEWEYACRAGTTTAYSWGDNPAPIDDYAWFEENSEFRYQKVGKKKPNPWGLHDLHGNAWEWCLDQYEENYDRYAADLVEHPWNRATRPYPHVVRGGSYDNDPTRLRSGARFYSDPVWKMRDPQLPKSVWWLTDAPWVGLRLIRPLNVPGPEELSKYWTSGVERD